MSYVDSLIGVIYVMESKLPKFDFIASAAKSENYDSKVKALRSVEILRDVELDEVGLKNKKLALYNEIYENLPEGDPIHKYLWLEMNISKIRSIVLSMTKSEASKDEILKQIREEVDVVEEYDEDVVEMVDEILENTDEADRIIDKFYFLSLKKSMKKGSMRHFADLLERNYQLSEISRLGKMGMSDENIAKRLEMDVADMKNLFENEMSPETKLNTDMMREINNAALNDKTYAILQYLNKIKFIFHNVNLVLFLKNDSEKLLVNYDA